MRLSPATTTELRQIFEFELASARMFGFEASFGTTLDGPVFDAINDIAETWPKHTNEQVQLARELFRRQETSHK